MVSYLLQRSVGKKLPKIRIHPSENETAIQSDINVVHSPLQKWTHNSQWLTPREERCKIFDILQGKYLHEQDSVELWYTRTLSNLPTDDN